MPIEYEQPFTSKYEEGDERKDHRLRFTVVLNDEEAKYLAQAMRFIQQPKPTTALKQLAFYGYFTKVIPSKSETYFRDILFKNERNNVRIGCVVDSEIETNVTQKIKK